MTNGPVLFDHSHQPVYRVVRRSWRNPLDATFSQRPTADNRWNTNRFPALYCCCSVTVARAVALDVLRYAGIELTDLRPDVQPRLVEISWSGEVVDVATAAGVNQEIIQDGVNGFLAATEDEWVEKVGLLLSDPLLREKLGLAGRRTVEERYSLDVNAPKFLRILQDVCRVDTT